MNSSILMAIESLCDDIASNTNPEDNKKRADAIVSLAFGGIFTPADEDEPAEAENGSRKIPAAGETFDYKGIKFRALGLEQGGVLAVVENPLKDELPFDEDNCNDWRKSTLRKHLNEEYIKNFIQESDLKAFEEKNRTDTDIKE